MAARNMLIIKNASGEIVAAQVEGRTDGEVVTYITPADPEHTLYRVSNVPAEIFDRVHPAEFQSMITEHVNSDTAEVTAITAEDLHQYYSGL
ncbi:hypothetical protein ACFY3G_52345 [Streptomyces phaeochromogenes]|jgi:hypothetical protein|uniref:hypothetical protein n=1 Tax=Streptomyces phaeochromogenes TaxID=1923 RepID=UPI0036865088